MELHLYFEQRLVILGHKFSIDNYSFRTVTQSVSHRHKLEDNLPCIF
jgi:hypothetical protein